MIRDRGLYGLLCGLVLVAAVGGAQGESSVEREQNAIQSYLGLIFQKLESHKRYPRVAARGGLDGRVVLRFTVRRDGEILEPEVVEVAGHDSFRKAALQALTLVGQLPPFPDEIRRRELLVEVPISYRIEKKPSLGDELFIQELLRRAEQAEAGGSKGLRRTADRGYDGAPNFLKGEFWQCVARRDYDKTTVLFTLTRERGGSEGAGEVAVAGITHPARFRVTGLERRWDFGYHEHRDAYLYAFVIKPDGTGLYYDFSTSSDGTTKANDLFKCLMSP